jgi:hypothetical protein
MYVSSYVCTYVFICVYVRVYACTCVCMHVRVYVFMYVCMWPIPVAVRSKAWVFGRSLARIVGSNYTGGMDVCLL